MKSAGKQRKKFDREEALKARPQALPTVRVEDQPGGAFNVTVRMAPVRWVGWFIRSKEIERTFSLDALGREVYEACDGKTDVKTIVRNFAAAHKISLVEAEMSVSAFLKTLTSKGLVALAVDRPRDQDGKTE